MPIPSTLRQYSCPGVLCHRLTPSAVRYGATGNGVTLAPPRLVCRHNVHQWRWGRGPIDPVRKYRARGPYGLSPKEARSASPARGGLRRSRSARRSLSVSTPRLRASRKATRRSADHVCARSDGRLSIRQLRHDYRASDPALHVASRTTELPTAVAADAEARWSVDRCNGWQAARASRARR